MEKLIQFTCYIFLLIFFSIATVKLIQSLRLLETILLS